MAKKYYYSSGEFFNLNMPGKKVISLEGNSTIIEIPIKAKFNFLNKQKTSLFASAGVISYLLTNEKNDYILLVNGAEMNMTNIYPDASRYFAGAIDLSAGFEYNIGNALKLRIEPYVQIPLKGIGVGTMDILSSGLHLTIFKEFTRPKRIKVK